MEPITRRAALALLAAAPAAGVLSWTDAEAREAFEQATRARRTAAQAKTAYKPTFFTAPEYTMIVTLVDVIIPKDDRSGGATDAGVPEFIDFLMADQPQRQVAMRGGLALIDYVCTERFDHTFNECTADQRMQVIEDLAYAPNGLAKPELSQAVAFFNGLRDLTATGFWTSKIGIEDLQYHGNVYVEEWKGCTDQALKKLGVSYSD
jgi:Gluconate 2-dehydrogenase subunit 3